MGEVIDAYSVYKGASSEVFRGDLVFVGDLGEVRDGMY